MPKPVCIACQIEFHKERMGVVADIHVRSLGGSYEAYAADLWRCPGCSVEILAGFGATPISHHFEDRHRDVVSGGDVYRVYENVGHREEAR